MCKGEGAGEGTHGGDSGAAREDHAVGHRGGVCRVPVAVPLVAAALRAYPDHGLVQKYGPRALKVLEPGHALLA